MDAKALTIIDRATSKLAKGGDWWKDLDRNERLLYTMRDGSWHFDTELADAAGWRFGSAIYAIRHLHGIGIERRVEPDPRPKARRRNQYRLAG